MKPSAQGAEGAPGDLYDALTGLVSLPLFKDRLGHALLRMTRADRQLALIVFEVTTLEEVDARSDHETADALLRSIGHRMRGALRKVDTLARLHGDRFAVIAEDLSRPESGPLVARKLEDALVQPAHIEGASIDIEIRGGVAIFPFDGTDPETLWAAAGDALQRAGAEGASPFVMANPEFTAFES